MTDNLAQPYKELLHWICAQNNAFVGPIEPHDFPDTGRGIRATRDLQPGELTLAIPEALLMHAGSAARCTTLQHAFRNSNTTPRSEEELLALHVLCEMHRGPASFWAPYLTVLPQNYTTLACFPSDVAHQLQAPHAVHAATHSRTQLHQSFKRVYPVLQQLGIPDRQAARLVWSWAVATCSSRTMYMPNSSAGTLTPLGDLHNYAPPPPPHVPELDGLCCGGRHTIAGCTWTHQLDTPPLDNPPLDTHQLDSGSTREDTRQEYANQPDGTFDEQRGLYRIVSPQRYLAGEQVFLCYGKHDNLQLLEHYGFVLNPNPHDCIPLVVPGGGTITLHCNGVPTWEGLRDLRLAALPRVKHARFAHLARCGARISMENDMTALRMLNEAAREALGGLPTTLKDDLQELEALGGHEETPKGPSAPREERAGKTEQGAEQGSVCTTECEALALQWRVMYKRALYWASMLFIDTGNR